MTQYGYTQKNTITLNALTKPFRFNPFDYEGRSSQAREMRLLATLEGIASLGFTALFAVAMYLANPIPIIWTLSAITSALLSLKGFIEYKRFCHAHQWIKRSNSALFEKNVQVN